MFGCKKSLVRSFLRLVVLLQLQMVVLAAAEIGEVAIALRQEKGATGRARQSGFGW